MTDKPQFLWLFFSLSGRVNPSAYVLAGLLPVIVQLFLLYQFARTPLGTAASQYWALALWIGMFVSTWSTFALTAKRFHDFGKPTYYALVSLIIGFVLLFILAFFKSDAGPNRYGKRTNAPAEP
ncbi:DUF805 domain-containing protein [Mesorhizobium sp. M1428]|uniref:DUF805 domain-containing protein n=1 Tax=unclassified Mesorhizobium TaxID=325217 RepID=UPI003338C949